jgi:ribonucleoside-diphosphate reductase beta chain
MKRNLLSKRQFYKPFDYPEFFELFKLQAQARWLPTEVSFADDIKDFKNKLTPQEINLIIQVLRFFTQGDIEVQNNYNTKLVHVFPKPEITSMLAEFAAMENIHVWAYSTLNETLGLPETEYQAFLDYQSMKDKVTFFESFHVMDKKSLAKNLAVFGGFVEGISLFASFAILMNFPRRSLLKNVGQIVTWSIRDEDLHSRGISRLYNIFIEENPEILSAEFIKDLLDTCRQIVALEDNFIDTCFSLGGVVGLEASEVKLYIRYIANMRLKALNLPVIYYDITENPLPYMNFMIEGREHANFFETRSTNYATGAIQDDY